MKEKLLAMLKALGLVKDDNQAQVEAELNKLELDKPPVIDASKVQDAGLKQMLETIQTEITILRTSNKQLADALASEKTEREKGIQAQQAAAKTEQEKKVKESVDGAIKTGKYPEAKREFLTKLFTNDFESATEVVKDAPVDKHFKPEAIPGKPPPVKQEGIKSPLDSTTPLFTKVKELANVTD